MPVHAALQQRLVAFVRAFSGGDAAEVTALVPDASVRRYYRVITGGRPATAVVMELPPDAPPPVSPGVGPAGPSFLAVQRYLAAAGLPVPAVLRADLEAGLIALEDLGDITLESAVRSTPPEHRLRLYARAVTLIADLQRAGTTRPDPGCLPFQRRFDQATLRWELDHFREWLLEKDRGVRLTDAEAEVVDAGFRWLATTLAESPLRLVHRDFQSRNLMVVPRPGAPDGVELKLIDFQDALLGSRAYDLVALLRDSYVELPPSEVEDLLARFCTAEGEGGAADGDNLRKLFHLQTVQRKLKDAGRFVFLQRARANPAYLPWIPVTLRYARDALAQVRALDALAEILGRHVPELRLR